MRYITLIFLFAASAVSLFAQPMRGQYTAEQMLETAEEQMEIHDYYQALTWYEKSYNESRSLDVAKKIADLNFLLRDYDKAAKWYKRVANKKSRKKPNPYLPEVLYTWGRTLKMTGSYPDAREQFKAFISESNNDTLINRARIELEGIELAMKMSPDSKTKITNAGKEVNTKSSEYSPVFVNDDQLYFTGMRENEVIELTAANDNYHSKLFVAHRNNGKWTQATETASDVINRKGYHTGNIAFSENGTVMFFTRSKLVGNVLAESKLYFSVKQGANDWGPAQEVTSLNSGDYIIRQPSIGELHGETVLFFVSDMDGGYGGYDIYYAPRSGDAFGNPVNLGSTINTDMDDETPFYKDGVLHFSSQGHPGIGGFDIFKSAWNGSEWSKPVNMGKPYNSPVDDLYYSINQSNTHGALISNREGGKSLKGKTCCTDIWEIVREPVEVNLAALTFEDGNKALNGVTVRLIEKQNGLSELDKKTNSASNDYAFPLEIEKTYVVIASKDGFESDTIEFNTVGFTESQDISKRFVLSPIVPPVVVVETPPAPPVKTISTPIVLQNIFYDFDDDKILAESEVDLNHVLDIMNRYPEMVVELSSHTDVRGPNAYNQALSQRRANSAKNWLVSKGVSADRIQAVGKGETEIRNHCLEGVKCSKEDHYYNRRTEFRIVSGPTTIEVNSSFNK